MPEITFVTHGPLGIATLNRPQALNAEPRRSCFLYVVVNCWHGLMLNARSQCQLFRSCKFEGSHFDGPMIIRNIDIYSQLRERRSESSISTEETLCYSLHPFMKECSHMPKVTSGFLRLARVRDRGQRAAVCQYRRCVFRQ